MITEILEFVKIHPEYGMVIAFGLAMLESLPVLGSFIPGFLTMPPIGWLIATHVLPATETLSLILVGGVIGDYLGFLLGLHCKDHVKAIAGHYKKSTWLEVGEGFVTRYGVYSIIIGRFIGPLRSSIPLFAGILNMRSRDFLIAAVPSVLLWALIHISPGFFLAWFDWDIMSPQVGIAAGCILTIIAAIVIDCGRFYLLKSIAKILAKSDEHNISPFYAPYVRIFSYFLASVASIVLAVSQSMQPINLAILHFMYSIQSVPFLYGALAMSNLAETAQITALFLVVALILLNNRLYKSLILFSTTYCMTFCFITILKFATQIQRPELASHFLSLYSFPSGHTGLAIPFVITLLPILSSRKFTQAYLILCMVITPFTRLYLGAHWCTDIIASITIACFCIVTTPVTTRIYGSNYLDTISPQLVEKAAKQISLTLLFYCVSITIISFVIGHLNAGAYYYANSI